MARKLTNRGLSFRESIHEDFHKIEKEDLLENVFTIETARSIIRTKFSTFHRLLGERESELLVELDRIEYGTKSRLEPLEADLKKLERKWSEVELSLKTNILKDFLQKQEMEIKNKISEIENQKISENKIILKWDISESIFGLIATLRKFRTKKEERETIGQLLELKPSEGETWYLVSQKWFQKWRLAVNFYPLKSISQDDTKVPMNSIPIDNSDIQGKELVSSSVVTLHSNAWDMLLGWHGMAEGSVPIPWKTYTNPHSNGTQVALAKLKFSYRIITGSKWGTLSSLSFYPTQTYQEVFDVVTEELPYDKQLIKMYTRVIFLTAKNVLHKLLAGPTPLEDSNLVTDFSVPVGTNTDLRFYFIVPVSDSIN